MTILHKRGADVILSGHTHRYERFAPITPKGKRANRGIRQFIVGTGGAPGVLKLRLGSGFYRWKFVPVAYRYFTDSGKGPVPLEQLAKRSNLFASSQHFSRSALQLVSFLCLLNCWLRSPLRERRDLLREERRRVGISGTS